MKKIILCLILLNFCVSSAQITQSIVNKSKFEQSNFPFKGKRVLMVDYISTKNEENYFVFSKNPKDSSQDELYIEQFTKENGKWKLKTSDSVADKNIITVTWDNRKAFSDVDKDGKADVIYVYTKNSKDNIDQQLAVVQLLFHGYKLYSITSYASTNYTEDVFSENFDELPTALKDFAVNFWNRLDKN